MTRVILSCCILLLLLSACVARIPSSQRGLMELTPGQTVRLEQGKRYFTAGSYRQALQVFLPLACEGSREAQYAIGYLYYYGYGVSEDKTTGLFWINRAANKGYLPAITARRLVNKK